MAQHDYVISNGTGAAVRSDLNNALLAIVSQNSGATEPTTTYAYQWWADTTTGLLKIRNSANNAWITLRELDGTLTVEDGTVSAPGLAFRDDLNTGIWRPGTDQFAISTNGVERVEWGTSEVVFNDAGNNYDFRIEGDNNANLLFVDASADAVGIGTSSPLQKLTVDGNILTTSAAGTDSYINVSTTGVQNTLVGFNNSGSTNAYGVSNNFSYFGNGNTYGLQLTTNGSARLTINSSGNVGIGTTAPSAKLEVSGGNIRLDNNQGVEWGGANNYIYGNESTDFIAITTNGNERARIDSSGRLLVGTSTATNNLRLDQKLAVVGTSASYPGMAITGYTGTSGDYAPILELQRSRGTTDGSYTKVENGDCLGKIIFRGADGSSWGSGANIEAYADAATGAGDLPTRLVFSTCADATSTPTERVRIGQLGYLKASNNGSYFGSTGTYHERNSNASDWVAVDRNSNATPYGVLFEFDADPNGTGSQFWRCRGGGVTRAELRSNGGIANFQANDVNLSDRNVKKDISLAAGTWDCIKEWEIVNYRYKDQPEDADLNLGVIAQQVAESCPEVITVFQEAKEATETEPAQEERLGVKEQQMMWMAIKALQEAQVRIEALEAEVAALKAQ